RRRHTRLQGDWSSDVCSSDLNDVVARGAHSERSAAARPVADAGVAVLGPGSAVVGRGGEEPVAEVELAAVRGGQHPAGAGPDDRSEERRVGKGGGAGGAGVLP